MSKLSLFALAFLVIPASAWAAEAKRAPFGKLPDGRTVDSVTLTNAGGITARIITLGATLQSLKTPDRTGKIDEITLGYDRLEDYLVHRQYFGVTAGRFANRIAKGRFSLEGRSYSLSINDGENHLHGGEVVSTSAYGRL